MNAEQERESIRETVHRGLHDIRELVRLEIDLARAELRLEMRSLRALSLLLGLGGSMLGVGALWVLVALTRGLADLLDWPVWAGYAAVGVPVLFIGSIAMALALDRVRTMTLLPRTRETLKDAAQRLSGTGPI